MDAYLGFLVFLSFISLLGFIKVKWDIEINAHAET